MKTIRLETVDHEETLKAALDFWIAEQMMRKATADPITWEFIERTITHAQNIRGQL